MMQSAHHWCGNNGSASSALLPRTMLLADRGYDADWIRGLSDSKEHGRTFRRNVIAKTRSALAHTCIARANDRTLLRRDQAMSACRDPIRQAANYLAFIKFASIRIWLRASESAPWDTGQSERSPDGDSHISAMRDLPVVLLCRSRRLLLKIRNIPILPASRLDTRDVAANRHET